MQDFNDYLMESYELREKLVADRFRPRYHFVPPEGRWNDINGAIFWKGRYHLGYLQKIANGRRPAGLLQLAAHQQPGPPPLALPQGLAVGALGRCKKGDYFNSGDVMEGMDVPTIITNMPRRGICIYQCHDDNLDHLGPPASRTPSFPLDPAPEGDRSMVLRQTAGVRHLRSQRLERGRCLLRPHRQQEPPPRLPGRLHQPLQVHGT